MTAAQSAGPVPPLALVPAPTTVEEHPGAPFALGADTIVTGEPGAAEELARLIAARTGLVVPTGAAGDERPFVTLRTEPGAPAESYRLVASAAGVEVVGTDAAGLFYGVQTLGQLIAPADDGWRIPAVSVRDVPRFGYRGVMLDVARHFFDVATVKGYIDRAAGLKMPIS